MRTRPSGWGVEGGGGVGVVLPRQVGCGRGSMAGCNHCTAYAYNSAPIIVDVVPTHMQAWVTERGWPAPMGSKAMIPPRGPLCGGSRGSAPVGTKKGVTSLDPLRTPPTRKLWRASLCGPGPSSLLRATIGRPSGGLEGRQTHCGK